MTRWVIGYIAAAIFMLVTVDAAVAEPVQIAVGTNKVWKHKLSKVQLPAALDGLTRAEIIDLGRSELDIAATYRSPDGATEATVYVFQAGLVNASIWHDRILTVMKMGRLGKMDPTALKTTAFATPGSPVTTGIRSVSPLSGGKVTASGVALFPLDYWLVSVRLSSTSSDATQLDQQLANVVAGMGLPKQKQVATAAYAIEDCQNPLADQDVPRAEVDPGAGLLGALVMQMADSGKLKTVKEADAKPNRFCRDKSSRASYGVYRADEETDGFILAFGDAGNAVFIQKDGLATVLDTKKPPVWSMNVSMTEQRLTYRGFAALPGPSQVVRVLQSENSMSGTSRLPGQGKTINITTP